MSRSETTGTDEPGQPLGALESASPFRTRHIGVSAAADRQRMLDALGYTTMSDLLADAIPAGIREKLALALPPAAGEAEVAAELRALADRNEVLTSMIGLGYYDTITPPVIRRNVLENPAWYTAYTPYQPEISQGRLEALLNFQTMVEDLTGLPVAGASVLDEATAAAEAMALAHRAVRGGDTLVVDADVFPQTLDVVRTRALPLGLRVLVHDLSEPLPDGELFGVLVQYPGASGAVRELEPVVAAAHERGALAIVAADLLALTLLRTPGEAGADIAVGTTQRFGVPLGFGGPHAGYLATRSGLERQLPGRLVGVSLDADGAPAYRLALQTREQHIRREKATSNICTAQVLLAVMASMYAVYHGPDGLAAIARRVHRLASVLAGGLRAGGVAVTDAPFFDTVTATVPGRALEIVTAARAAGINLRLVDPDTVSVACDEATRREHLLAVWAAFGVTAEIDDHDRDAALPRLRATDFLTHPVFTEQHSETTMLRYLRRLADRDYALDRGMIPLGSCTMKLNATTEMEPITNPGFARLHPFAPTDQAAGYLRLFADLERWLAEITGYDAVSLQPNAGSQGEFAGLLAIRNYHLAHSAGHRDVCLIPASAHGTNAASAVMAGMRVVVVATSGEQGDVDLDDLRRKIAEHADVAGRGHGDLPVHARRVRGPDRRGVRARARGRRPGLRRRRQPQRDGRAGPAGPLRRRRVPPEPAQDVLHPARRRRPGRRPDRCARAPRAVPAQPPAAARRRAGHRQRCRRRGAVGLGVHPADHLGLPAADGRRGLTEATGAAILSANYLARRLRDHFPVLYAGGTAWWRTSASWTCGRSPAAPA